MLVKKGFSLIELLVVMFILILVAGSGVIVFQKMGDKRNMDRAVKDLKNLIDEAHSMALNQSSSSNNLRYYRIEINRNNKTARLRPVIYNLTNGNETTQGPIKTVTLKTEAIIFKNLAFEYQPANPTTYSGCTDSPDTNEDVCFLDFTVSSIYKSGPIYSLVSNINEVGTVQVNYWDKYQNTSLNYYYPYAIPSQSNSKNPKVCLVNNYYANTEDQIWQCLTVNQLTGQVTVSSS
jgi:prepilin-type N-terminal cleavage/methylation domain-containing protein